MKQEFNLSDRIKTSSRGKDKGLNKRIKVSDVKEFIRLLKEKIDIREKELIGVYPEDDGLSGNEVIDWIDKLAGEKLK